MPGGPQRPSPDDEVPKQKLRITATIEDTWAFEGVRRLVEQQHGGHASHEQVLEALLAEGLGSLLTLADDASAVDLEDHKRAQVRAERQRQRREQEAAIEQAEADAEAQLQTPALQAVLDLPTRPDVYDPRAIDTFVARSSSNSTHATCSSAARRPGTRGPG